MVSYYMWRGVDAIEDLEDCISDEEAMNALHKMVTGDWTLWRREGYNAVLIATFQADRNVFHNLIAEGY